MWLGLWWQGRVCRDLEGHRGRGDRMTAPCCRENGWQGRALACLTGRAHQPLPERGCFGALGNRRVSMKFLGSHLVGILIQARCKLAQI